VTSAGSRVSVTVDDRRLVLTNLDKPLFADGTTKAAVIAYYTAIAPVLLPHLRHRPLTLRRWPDGTQAAGFFEKNVARTAPPWVHQVDLPVPGSTTGRQTIAFVTVDDLPTLVWVANLAGLELHVPQWRLGNDDQPTHPDRLVIDLDPGAPADLVTCCRVAVEVRQMLAEQGVQTHPTTSGNKGMQLYARLDGSLTWQQARELAQHLAERLERRDARVVSRMDTRLRHGKVLLDWSQNHGGKTTISPYSLRGRALPSVSTPLSWEEVEAADDAAALQFGPDEVLARVAQRGDLLASVAS
jgi:bifunctional non-homologous end joining protein LigD